MANSPRPAADRGVATTSRGTASPPATAAAVTRAAFPAFTSITTLPCAGAHPEPVADERHELMPDVHRAKSAAQPPYRGTGDPREKRPGAKHYIDLVEHMKCDTADAAGLSARCDAHPPLQEAVGQLRQHGGNAD